jgi:hypothetical protein
MFTLDPATLQEVPAYEYFVADAERILFDFLLNANLDTTSNEECSLLQKAAYCVARRNNTPDDILQRIKDIHSRFGSFSPQE